MKKSKIVQIELWLDCPYNCTFCCLGDYKNKTNSDTKIQTVQKAIDILDTIDWSTYSELALIGGELFAFPFSDTLSHVFDTFIQKIILFIKQQKIKRFYIMTSLMMQNEYFWHIIDTFIQEDIQDYLMINTSYDTKYRFNDSTKQIWIHNLQKLDNKQIQVHIETILTDFFLDSYMNKNAELHSLMQNYSFDILRPTRP